MSEKKYRWKGPHEWLEWAIANGVITLEQAWMQLKNSLEPELIEDIFAEDMDKTGYYERYDPLADEDEEDDEEEDDDPMGCGYYADEWGLV